ncbi:MAG: proline iminopeptidase-family hydrolase [Longimicrobiales bacterium]|nr:proline iminopeptidase-family hydrolase [Longimicrobiales bacterium]
MRRQTTLRPVALRLTLLPLLLSACAGEGAPPQGAATLSTPFGELWYDVVGEGSGTPAVLLHGGPGINSYYMNPMRALGADRPVVLYDQLGSGRSTSATGPSDWTIATFVRELDTLRAALGFDRMHLVGHSWGTILAAEYWRAHPERVASVVFMSPALSVPAWVADADTLLMTLPETIQGAVREHEAAGTYEDPAYQDAVTRFYEAYLARSLPWSADLDSAFAAANFDIYGAMWGPSEFTATGTLKDYDATGWLGEIDVPVLFTTGEFDESRPATVRRIAALVPGAEVAVIPGAAHLTMHDRPDDTNAVVRDFLRRVDGG